MSPRRHADIAIIGLADRPTIYQDYTRNAELLDKAIGRLFAQPAQSPNLPFSVRRVDL